MRTSADLSSFDSIARGKIGELERMFDDLERYVQTNLAPATGKVLLLESLNDSFRRVGRAIRDDQAERIKVRPATLV